MNNQNRSVTPVISGVYKIHNHMTNKTYIGESVDIGNRFSYHLEAMLNGTHENRNMQADCKKYGIESFGFSVIRVIGLNNKGKAAKQVLIDYLLYMESAYYRKLENEIDAYNISIPYQAIDSKYLDIPFYDVNYENVKKLLDEDPFDIGYEKIDWTPEIVEPSLTASEIIDSKQEVEADKFIRSFPQDMKIKLFWFTTKHEKYHLVQPRMQRALMCVFSEMGKLEDLKRQGKYYMRAFLTQKNIENKYMYQREDVENETQKKYLNMKKPVILSHQAQVDVYEYLSNFTEHAEKDLIEMYKATYRPR